MVTATTAASLLLVWVSYLRGVVHTSPTREQGETLRSVKFDTSAKEDVLRLQYILLGSCV